MKKSSMFFTNFIMSAIRYGAIFISALALAIVGTFWLDVLSYIALTLIAIYLIICIISTLRMQKIMNYRSEDDPEFNKMMDEISTDPHKFMEELIKKQNEYNNLHGESLMKLSDDELFDAVYFQNIELVEEAGDENVALESITKARKTIYVVNTFDAEIQNGGLCQFFVNSSRSLAPFVCDCLNEIGATEHQNLFQDFIITNNIDVFNLDSFIIYKEKDYVKQTKRFDYDSFDDSYYDLPPLQEKTVSYIRNNINEF